VRATSDRLSLQAAIPSLLAAAPTLGIAACFGLAATLARLAFASGVNVISLTTARTAFALVAIAVLLRWRPAPVPLARAERHRAWALGLVLCVQVYCLYKAVELMPVAIAITVYYAFPVLVILANAALDRRPLPGAVLGPALLAAVGILLALGAREGAWPMLGVAYALVAAAGFATLLIASTRLFRPADTRPRTLAMLAAATPIFVAVSVASGEFSLPDGTRGWLALAGVLAFYALGFIGVFWSANRIGPARTATLLNFEPVAAVAFGAAILGEHMTPVQLAGVGIVIAALFLAARAR